ncbi:putative Acyl-CoA N-acyltransferase [Vibrio nigripulchritudo SOn1]|uniref:Acyl-CoA N-acyltransferase n=1 Tax=Vibrio nigripulchritudo SOn1 TaxID=1238450 RepID=A0AAV2VNA4_9VIBR|nr:GNAT family N-acetyltransferase [Vibrio nigripulchritudo]CCO46213.1 putative Acyl-CoA N-acyltransferase [Vibrio nigripulchritudo SOn1]
MELIRIANKDDLTGILRLYKELRGNDPDVTEEELSETWTAMQNNPHTTLVVAEVDGHLASTCQLGLVPTVTNAGKPFGIIEHVITSENFRRRGLSQKVLEKALELAWELDCYQVVLLSGETRFSAHRLYEKVGFQSGIEKGFVIKAP